MRAFGLRTLALSASIAALLAPAAIAQVTLRGIVVTEDGQPIKGAAVTACYFRYGFGSTCPKTKTDGKGEFSISVPQPPAVSDPRGSDERAVDLQARKDRDGYNWTEVRHTDWANPSPTFRLVLRKGGNVRVVVEGVDPAQWEQIQVKVIGGGKEFRGGAIVPHKQLDFMAYSRSGATSIEEYLDRMPAAASFPIRDVPVGEARVEVTLPDGQAFPPQTVRVTTGREETIHFAAQGKGLRVSGRVTDAGVPMKDLMVSFSRPGATDSTGVPTGADGSFQIDLEPGPYVVRVMRKGTANVGGTSVVAYEELGSLEQSFSEAATLDLEIGKLEKPTPN
jgi:hypothetical protein